jgi:hypothetical protein
MVHRTRDDGARPCRYRPTAFTSLFVPEEADLEVVVVSFKRQARIIKTGHVLCVARGSAESGQERSERAPRLTGWEKKGGTALY